MNIMAELAMQNESFRESYSRGKLRENKVFATLLKEGQPTKFKESEVELMMEWLANQRFPEITEEEDSNENES